MHFALARDALAGGGEEPRFHAYFPEPALVPPAPPVPYKGGGYGAQARPSWLTIGAVLVAHAGLLAGLMMFDVIDLPHRVAPKALTVVDLSIAPPPPPVAAAPEVKPEIATETPPVIVAPPPIVAAPAPPPTVVTVAEAPPPRAVIVAPAAPAVAAPAAPVAVDLASKLVAGKPPVYPVESRRKREQGTVVLRVTVGEDGAVAAIDIARTSGFDRLDKAALAAVKRWRWSPTMQAGQPVQVRGTVDIPFVLQG